MDWAMFSILSRTNVASSFAEVMADQVVFSRQRYDDDAFSELFREKISPEDAERFKDKWLESVKQRDAGITEAWIAIDGSNADCDMSGGDLPAVGKAKSRRDGSVAGYMYAVDSRNGLPLTFEVFRGGNIPDTKALQRMRNRLQRFDVKARGAILARHLATFVAQIIRSVFVQHCRQLKMDAARMIKEMDRLHISLVDSGNYACVHDESVRQRKLLGAMGLSVMEDLETVTADINRRNSEAVVSQIHRMPSKANPNEARPRGRKAKKLKDIAEGRRPAEEEPKPKGMRGRPKGSKNKTSAQNTEAVAHEQKRGPGRPKGSTKKKHGKTKDNADTPKRGPGRPKGSKNKKTLLREARQAKRERRKNKDGT